MAWPNRLATMTVDGTSVSFVYDGDHKRVGMDDGTIVWRYIHTPVGMTIEKQDGVVYARYVRLPSGTPLAIDGPDGTFFYLIDASANVRGIIDATGTVDWYDYRPFGEVDEEPASPKYNPLRFAGTYRHEVNGHELYQMWNRWYDSKLGRFTQVDPNATCGAVAMPGYASYEYAWNNPVNLIDPTGLSVICERICSIGTIWTCAKTTKSFWPAIVCGFTTYFACNWVCKDRPHLNVPKPTPIPTPPAKPRRNPSGNYYA